jgi:AcrR family transcriptional regulator
MSGSALATPADQLDDQPSPMAPSASTALSEAPRFVRDGARPPAPVAKRGSARQHVSEAQRIRILWAMVDLTCMDGDRTATVSQIVGLASVSRNTFYALFDDCNDCLLAAMEQALVLARAKASAGCDPGQPWVSQIRGGLHALLRFFDNEPKLARLCVVNSASAGPVALARRWEVLDELVRVLDEGRRHARRQPPPLTAQGVVGGVLSVVHARLAKPELGTLTELLNPLMAIIVNPYRGGAAAQRELSRPVLDTTSQALDGSRVALNPLDGLDTRLTYRTVRVLAVIASHPGLSNMEVSERAGVANQGQISKLLTRLTRAGLIENTGEGQARGASNAWRLTARGREVRKAVADDDAQLERASSAICSNAASGFNGS